MANNKGDNERVELRSRLVAREIKQKGTESYFVRTPPFALVRYVMRTSATLSKTGKRRRAFLHADALTETYLKSPYLRNTKRCWLLVECMYDTLPAGWQHLVQVSRQVQTEMRKKGKKEASSFRRPDKGQRQEAQEEQEDTRQGRRTEPARLYLQRAPDNEKLTQTKHERNQAELPMRLGVTPRTAGGP